MIERSSFVITCRTVLRTNDAFVGILAGGTNRVGVPVVGALGGGAGAGFGGRIFYQPRRIEDNVD